MLRHTLLWSFVWAVALVDAAYAWNYRESFMDWEMNPFMTSLCTWLGMPAVVGFRLLGIGCACLVINLAQPRVRFLASCFVFLVHLGLLVHYAPILVQVPILGC